MNILIRNGTGYLSLVSDLLDLATWSQHVAKENYCYFATFSSGVDMKTSVIQRGPNILNLGQKMYLKVRVGNDQEMAQSETDNNFLNSRNR